jgi:3-oxoacyl-[acyl-carrier protein] reductase
MTQPTLPRVAIITGAARGIGLEIATKLALRGDQVILADRLDLAHESAAILRSRNLLADSHVADIADARGIASLLNFVKERYGRLDILINNAGISPKHNGEKLMTVDTPLSEWQEVVRINLTGPFQMCSAFVPLMRVNGWGRIVSMSSLAGRTGSKMTASSYSATKAGLIGFSRVLAEEVGREGITVNCIAPGRIETPMSRESGAAIQNEYASRVPVGRLGSPHEIAAAVAFFTSESAGNITGATLDINGGVFTN